MEWVLRGPQIHSTFSNLGFVHADGYHVNENCNVALESILYNILTEDKYLRTYRRNISFGQNIKKDLIPLLIHAKEDKTIELLIRILVNLTIPIECLLSVDVISKNDFGRHIIFEINNLLASTKAAFSDNRATKVVIEFLKKNIDYEQKAKLNTEQCENISNSLLLLRNILHIPEDSSAHSPTYNGSIHVIQNQILWNIFSQSIDKVLIKLMTVSDSSSWCVTMVQLIALLYKDQHVVTLHKLLNLWLEASLSESSEDNESNTSPPDRGSEDSSPMLTSDPTSDSSDTGASGKCNDEPNSVHNRWDASSINNSSENGNQMFQHSCDKESVMEDNNNCNENIDESIKPGNERPACGTKGRHLERCDQGQSTKNEKKTVISENSDCGYGTQIENQGSVSTSSNDDELPSKKPIHHKPHNPKQRINNKMRSSANLQERKRKKIVKRGKSNIINVQGLSYKTPTDDDISNVLKEFTVDFLLKGYNFLVQTLHKQILTNMELEIDTSHFFWLVTYFLKFATQIELDVEHVSSVLSFDVVSYLTAEGVNLCEQFELAIKLDGNDVMPSIRRIHLVVTAIREFVQAFEVFRKLSHPCKDDQQALMNLQIKMCESEELRSLLVLLLRHYNPKYHSKQYLQDLVVTNHILLMFLDSVMKLPDYSGSTKMLDHIRQFATPEIMYQYGLLLEDYAINGEFVNDCIFTLMHHVGGDLGCLITLFQPKILKTFTSIWRSEFEICDDWSDLIEYVINTFIKKPLTLQSTICLKLDTESFVEEKLAIEPLPTLAIDSNPVSNEIEDKKISVVAVTNDATNVKWSEEEISALSWNFMQCNGSPDIVGDIVKIFKEDGVMKSKDSVIEELFKQNLIKSEEYEKLIKKDSDSNKESMEIGDDEISKLCDQLKNDGKGMFLEWVQKVLLDTCYVKIFLEKKKRETLYKEKIESKDFRFLNFELFKKKSNDLPVLPPISYHSLLNNQSVPLVTWNCTQASICKDLKFLQLLHKLGFHMPVDSGKVFIRIPHFWTADFLYDVATRISPVDHSKLRFSLNELTNITEKLQENLLLATDTTKDETMTVVSDNFYQVNKQKHFATMVNFTPKPAASYTTDSCNVNKQNWLEVVQKSQEYKISLNLESGKIIANNEVEDDVVMMAPLKEGNPVQERLVAPGLGDKVNAGPPTALLLMPSVVTLQQGPSHFNANTPEADVYNNSVYETASVVSDLTQMYVSDEEEKPDILLQF